jgi:hypothetical protein
MPEQIENHMIIDSFWDEIEYGIPSKARLRREKQNYDLDELEEEDFEE